MHMTSKQPKRDLSPEQLKAVVGGTKDNATDKFKEDNSKISPGPGGGGAGGIQD
jgi:hypothetical protein